MLAEDLSDPRIDRIVEDLWRQGWSVGPDFLEPAEAERLAAECAVSWREGEFRRAGVGKGPRQGEPLKVDDAIRRDYVHWLEEAELARAQRRQWQRLEQLRAGVNRELMLGLFDYEGHLTVYPPGAFYRKHLDQFRNDGLRQLSCIQYLNPDWQPGDGGELRLYLDESGEHEWLDVPPRAGTLVVFLSARFWHEVLPARRERLSWTGWFRRRP